MQRNDKKKICLVVSSLGQGGAQKVGALLSVMLHDLGHDVHIVSVLDIIDFNYKGTLFNLGALKVTRFQRLLAFKNYLKKERFNCIIDNRSRVQTVRDLVVSKLIYNVPTLYIVHNYKTNHAFSKYNWLNKWLYQNEMLVMVSKAAEEKFKNKFKLKNTQTIYNAVDFVALEQQANAVYDHDFKFDKYILFYGRLNNHHKNLKFLLQSYKNSILIENGYKLILLGDGNDTEELKAFVNTIGIAANVEFIPYVKNPLPYVRQAKFTVLTSNFEGFPMVLLESLALSTPVVSVNCKSGPSEILIDNKNGLLVEQNNQEAFVNAMNSFILDDILYQKCKQNSKKSIQKFAIHNIAKDWAKVINTLTN